MSYSLHTARVAGARAAKQDAPPASKAIGIARATTLVGAALHTVGVVARGVEAGHVPWSSMYEFTISGSLVAVLVFLALGRKRDAEYLGAGVTGLATLALGLALPLLYGAAQTLQPALKSFWLVVHVSIAVAATGVFAVAFIVTLMQLQRHRAFLAAAPEVPALEALAFRLNAFGFVLWTFTVIAGAVWAEAAWGRFWGWDAKEVWSFVIWLIYAAYLHARTTRGWSGKRAAYLAIAGFVAVILNFTVVNLVFQGLHSYAGV